MQLLYISQSFITIKVSNKSRKFSHSAYSRTNFDNSQGLQIGIYIYTRESVPIHKWKGERCGRSIEYQLTNKIGWHNRTLQNNPSPLSNKRFLKYGNDIISVSLTMIYSRASLRWHSFQRSFSICNYPAVRATVKLLRSSFLKFSIYNHTTDGSHDDMLFRQQGLHPESRRPCSQSGASKVRARSGIFCSGATRCARRTLYNAI